jgi:hypothetical protein
MPQTRKKGGGVESAKKRRSRKTTTPKLIPTCSRGRTELETSFATCFSYVIIAVTIGEMGLYLNTTQGGSSGEPTHVESDTTPNPVTVVCDDMCLQAESAPTVVAQFSTWCMYYDNADFVSVYESDCDGVLTCVEGDYGFDGIIGSWNAVERAEYKVLVHSKGPFALNVSSPDVNGGCLLAFDIFWFSIIWLTMMKGGQVGKLKRKPKKKQDTEKRTTRQLACHTKSGHLGEVDHTTRSDRVLGRNHGYANGLFGCMAVPGENQLRSTIVRKGNGDPGDWYFGPFNGPSYSGGSSSPDVVPAPVGRKGGRKV